MQTLFNLVYAPSLVCDAYIPSTPAPAAGYPVIVNVHGGGGTKGDKRWQAGSAKLFAQNGFVVVCPNYTLTLPGSLFPDQLDEIEACFLWAQDPKSLRGVHVDVTKFAIFGTSAGGNHAAFAGCQAVADPGFLPGLVCTAAWSGPYDFPLLFADPSNPHIASDYTPYMDAFFGPGDWAPTSQGLRDASPAWQPVALPHFGRSDPGDTLVFPAETTGYAAHLTEIGVEHDVKVYPTGAYHGTALAPQAGTETVAWFRRMLS